ncbi:hypothetical protein TRFO_36558 [Tritrichomonas foetus]|uniref:Uncharacterized protein n=1 Tax=Tritrichomonas foetus TaxID=1144522 RepID=A0A1J4JDR3_9EUKA|nr:hypothetical protein TRFO_36558 [Tritrichomonas foetus]|eukprot:OHS97240.1 hypothetical protein TRFO_36558 [Tritrichomonas foetus]
MILTTKLTPESLKIAEKLLLYLLKNKLSNLLIKKGLDTQILTYYAIAPFVFASETTSKTEEELNNPGIKQAFQAIATSHNIESLKNFHEAAKRNIVFESLLKFYQTILVIGTIPQIKAAVTLASLLVSDQLIGDLQILSDFSREVNKHKEYELQESVNFFLSSIMMRFAGQIRHPSNKASQQFPELFGGPKISEILEWRPKENVFDIFENVSTYPPLFLTDFSLYISNFMADLKNVMEQIKVQPYSKWGDEIFAGQIQAKPVEPVPKFDPKETETFFRTQEEIDQILKNLKKVTRAKAHKNNAHAKMSPNDDAEDEALKSCTIESSLFCPDKELIDSIEIGLTCFVMFSLIFFV